MALRSETNGVCMTAMTDTLASHSIGPKSALNTLRDAPNWVPILEKPTYAIRRLRVVCIGAGYSGLTVAHEVKHNRAFEGLIDLTIYDKNDEIGGTWLENRYPGVAVRLA